MPRALLAALGVAMLWMSRHGSGAPVAATALVQAGEKNGTERAKLAPLFFGNKACAGTSCHERPEPVRGDEKDVTAIFTRHHEMSVWSKSDKHKDAAKVLTYGLGKDIAERMGISVNKIDFVAGKVQWKQCLSCHGVYVENDAHADKKTFAPMDRADSGVSCVACHGSHAEWVTEHTKPVNNDWASFNNEQKEAKFGLNNLWNAEKRAELCTSCHIGNAAQGKVVTHEMYAAGHPPLPGFEMATFSEAMPRHWETWAEKLKRLPKQKDAFAKAYQFDAERQQGEFEQARMATVAGVVAFRESMKLAADQAEGRAKVNNQTLPWPEFAAFDCYACHHDLKRDSWRQKRGYKGIPGRPQLRDWPLALLLVSIDHAAHDGAKTTNPTLARSAFDQELHKLIQALNDRPFGEPKTVAHAARTLEKWCSGLIAQLEKGTYDRASTDRLLSAITSYAQKETVDFDSARQLAWAFTTLKMELETCDVPVDKKPRYNTFMKDRFSGLNDLLNLTLAEGQTPIAGKFMVETMKQIREYEPKKFRENLR